MGIWDRIKNELIDIIEWLDSSHDTMVYRFERHGNEIKYGAKLIVRESQVAVFINEGKLADIYSPGTYTLETKNMPVLTTLNSWKYGFNSPFKAEVYFVSMNTFTNNKWGTKNPIMLRDPEFGPIRLRAFGTYAIKVKDPATVIRSVAGTDGKFTVDEISEQLRNQIITRFTNIIGESKIPALDLASNYDQLSSFVMTKIRPEFESFGIEVASLLIENISLPPAVEEALDKRSSMGIIGNLNQYTQFQAANALEDAAKNPGGTAAGGMGMGMGFAMAQQMAQSMSQTSGQSAAPPMPQQSGFFVNINNQQSGPFDIPVLQNMAREGKLTQETFVWKNGMPQWVPAKQAPELSSVWGNVPPPVPHSGPPPVPPAPPPAGFYININNEQSGPHNLDVLEQMAKEGSLKRDTMVWKNGMENWLPALQVPNLESFFSHLPPPINNNVKTNSGGPPELNINTAGSSAAHEKKLKSISKGQKLSLANELNSQSLLVGIYWDSSACQNYDISTSALLLSERGKLEKDENFVFYNNLSSPDGSVSLLDKSTPPYKKVLKVNLNRIDGDISRVLILLTIDDGDKLDQRCENVKDLKVDIVSADNPDSGLQYKAEGLIKETAVMLLEIYKRNNEWKVQAIGDGYNAGLDSILDQYEP
jgi:membrane protease subunit (stomatin/prohibitin family)/stress response protein SCP2